MIWTHHQIQNDKMGGAHGTHRRVKKCTGIWWRWNRLIQLRTHKS